MEFKSIKIEKQYRSFSVDRSAINQESRTVAVSFSSETPVERWYGIEILSHDAGAVRLDRLNTGGAVLLNHDPDQQIGVVEQAVISSDRKGRAVIRFSDSPTGQEIFNDIQNGIRSNVSVGYQIHAMTLVEEKDGVATYRATDWEPLEISIVPIPADVTVGVGRAYAHNNSNSGGRIMDNLGVKSERSRVEEILAIGELYKQQELARQFVTEGRSIQDMKSAVLERIGKSKPIPAPDDDVFNNGIDQRDLKDYSIVRALAALSSNDFKAAGYEREISRTLAKKMGREVTGLIVPFEAFSTRAVQKIGSGGNLIATELLAGDFISMLTNQTLVLTLGATTLSGLTGDIAIPRQTGGATAYWVSEDINVTASDPAFDQVSMTPKTVGALTQISRKMLIQGTPDIENLVKTDLSRQIAVELDRVAVNGSGSGSEPRGILNVTGSGSVAIGTNGGAPTASHLIELEKVVAAANVMQGQLAYLGNANVRSKLKRTFTNATYGEIPIWGDGLNGFGTLNGYKAGVSENVPSNLTKGTGTNLSAIIFGNWADLLIGFWGPGVELTVDPYTNFASGAVRVRCLLDCDVAVRHAVSFGIIKDADTV